MGFSPAQLQEAFNLSRAAQHKWSAWWGSNPGRQGDCRTAWPFVHGSGILARPPSEGWQQKWMILSQGSETPAVPGPVAFRSPHAGPTIWLSQTCSESTCEEKIKQQVSELHSYSWEPKRLMGGGLSAPTRNPQPFTLYRHSVGNGDKKTLSGTSELLEPNNPSR